MLTYQRSPQWPYKVSAGGVVYRINEQGVREYALLYRSRESYGEEGDSYHLPKGTVEVGESLEETALREIEEEAGVVVELKHFLTGATVTLPPKVKTAQQERGIGFTFTMTILYFLTEYKKDSTAGMDHEHDELVWKQASEAIDLLARIPKQEEHIIELAEAYFEKVADGTLSQ